MELYNTSWTQQYDTFFNCCDTNLANDTAYDYDYNWDNYSYNLSGYSNTSAFSPNFSFLQITKYVPKTNNDELVWEFKLGDVLILYCVPLITPFGLIGNVIIFPVLYGH